MPPPALVLIPSEGGVLGTRHGREGRGGDEISASQDARAILVIDISAMPAPT